MAQGWDPNRNYNPYAAPIAMIAPPSRTANERMLAGRSTRFAARLVDNMLFAFSGLPTLVALWVMHGKMLAYATAVVPLGLVAYQCFLVATTGQSVAKKWMGLRVVRTDGSPVTFVSGVVIREWVFFAVGCIPGLGMLIRLVDSLMILGEERRCLHDQLSATKVILAESSLSGSSLR